MTCKGNAYSRWGPKGCGRKEMIDHQRKLYREGAPIMVPCFVDKDGAQALNLQGKKLKGLRRMNGGVLVSEPPPPVRKKETL